MADQGGRTDVFSGRQPPTFIRFIIAISIAFRASFVSVLLTCRGGRRTGQGDEVHIAFRLASQAFDFEPGVAAVDELVDRRRRVDGFAVCPNPLVLAFAEQSICLSK
jgi:hypothetical protein